jgi:hypothetical protein
MARYAAELWNTFCRHHVSGIRKLRLVGIRTVLTGHEGLLIRQMSTRNSELCRSDEITNGEEHVSAQENNEFHGLTGPRKRTENEAQQSPRSRNFLARKRGTAFPPVRASLRLLFDCHDCANVCQGTVTLVTGFKCLSAASSCVFADVESCQSQ